MAYLPLSTANLPDPVIDPAKGVEPRDYFETFLYTGNGGGLQVGDVIKKPADTTTISNSLIFNDDDSAYLSRTPASAGNRKIFTISVWVKRGKISASSFYPYIFDGGTSGEHKLSFVNNYIAFGAFLGSQQFNLETTAVFRDPSVWYHIVVSVDTTQATASDRVKIYVNGQQVTSFRTSSYPSLNYEGRINSTETHAIGRWQQQTSRYFDGYMGEFHFVDGTALNADYFGNFDANGIWIPKTVTGLTYGTNGFHLDFSDGTSTTTLGEDQKGSNDWTLNNFATTDQVSDSPTNNFVTLNPLATSLTLSDGNLKASGGSTHNAAKSTMAISAGMKIYVEVTFGATPDGAWFGLTPRGDNETGYTNTDRTGLYSSSAASTFFGSGAGTNVGGPLLNNGDTWGMAVDFDSGRAWFAEISGGTPTWYARNGSNGSQYAPDGASDNLFEFMNSDTGLPLFVLVAQNSNPTVNFGQKPFAISSVPTGFLALSENNITVDDQNLESPDFVWIKARTARSHYLFDSVRGVYKALTTNSTAAEATYPDQLQSFNTNGFTIGSLNGVNAAGEDYVAWCWKAGGSGVSNTDGNVTSTVSANTTSGFSVVTWTGDESVSDQIGHGLSQKPDVIIARRRDGTHPWVVWGEAIGTASNSKLVLNTTGAIGTTGSIGASTNTYFAYDVGGGELWLAYCFHSVEGFSKFGSYTGNGSSDGVFVYTGFRPAFVMIKNISASNTFWIMFDVERDTYNVMDTYLQAQASNAEASFPFMDFLSNGFKHRHTSSHTNTSGQTYIYMAFAEQPFKFSNAR
jgi:hypothetical protein